MNGFGWVVDNFWSQGITAIRPPVANDFTDITYLSFSSVAYYVGLIIGASFWGVTADLIGRKPAFNATILIGGIFACAVAGSQNFITFCSLWAVVGTVADELVGMVEPWTGDCVTIGLGFPSKLCLRKL